jgi:hypothetical protein
MKKELRKLQVELCHLQQWIKEKQQRIVIVLEGRDGAGKGGTIKALTERVSPRIFRTVALPAPSSRQQSQMYMQRYVEQFPAAGEIVIFDRSWYNRAGVEWVMGFCTKPQYERFLKLCPVVEQFMVEGGTQTDQVVARGEQSGTAAAIRGTHQGPVAPVEAQPNGSAVTRTLVRLFARTAIECWRRPTPRSRPGSFCVRMTRRRPA